MYTGVVHVVSSNPLHGNSMKKKTTPPFFSNNLLPKKKPSIILFSCRSSNRNNDQTAPEFSENNQTEILPSKNGRSNSNDPKSVNQELRKILAKYFPLMQEAAEKNTVKNSRNYGNYVSKSAREKIEKSKVDAFANLLELVKNTGLEKKKGLKQSSGNVDNETYIRQFFEYDDNLDSENESDSESDSEPVESESESVPIESDSVPVESVPVQSRPKSSFSKRSPIPEVKYEPIVALNARQERKDESETESKSVFYEPVSLDSDDDESLDLDSGKKQDLEIPDLETRDLENRDLESRKMEESRDLGSLKMVELREIAKAKGMKGYSKMKKADLVEQLSSLS